MSASTRANRFDMNTAWRIPGSSSKVSMHKVVTGCVKLSTGNLIVPGYKTPSTDQRYKALWHLDWRSGIGSAEDGFDYHGTCTGSSAKFGTFRKDSASHTHNSQPHVHTRSSSALVRKVFIVWAPTPTFIVLGEVSAY